MKILFIILFPFYCFAQDTVRIIHKNFTDVYSISKKYVVLAEWKETPANLDCKTHYQRTNKFYADKYESDLNKDYVHTGYDKGHNYPASSANCDSTTERECFIFSNITPQAKLLNRGKWKTLETLTRHIADKGGKYIFKDKTITAVPGEVDIWCGSFGNSGKFIGKDHVSIPAYCWKIIYVKKACYKAAFLFKNENNKDNTIIANQVTIDSLDKLTGFKL